MFLFFLGVRKSSDAGRELKEQQTNQGLGPNNQQRGWGAVRGEVE